jgi:hypothetical protein
VTQISDDKNWVRIRIHADLYEGWLAEKQHHAITKDFFEQINHANYKISTDLTSSLLYKKSPLTILLGSIVPISNSELFKMEEQFAFNGESKSLGQKREYEFLKFIALKYLNAPYQWGGKSPFGIDCSGFTQMVFKISGYPMLRDASQQASHGKKVNSLSEALPGDLAYFQNSEGHINHVGIILEEDKIIHASGKVHVDLILEEGILNAESKIYTHHLGGIRRILSGNS